MHGGTQPTGIASSNTIHGRYSKNLPTRLMERYSASLADNNQLALSDDLALLDSRLEDVLGKVDTGESGETWKALQDAVTEFDKAERGANNTDNERKQAEYKFDREEAMRTIIVLVQAGMSDYAAWGEVKSLLEQRRKMAETETKRRVSMQQMITANEALLLQSALLDIIRRNVTDRDTLSIISRDIAALNAS